jgi:hypothetical protein
VADPDSKLSACLHQLQEEADFFAGGFSGKLKTCSFKTTSYAANTTSYAALNLRYVMGSTKKALPVW